MSDWSSFDAGTIAEIEATVRAVIHDPLFGLSPRQQADADRVIRRHLDALAETSAIPDDQDGR
ncbi:hypothetical protein [Frankia sp. CiP1_Cm_nod2]|uniref:hypothetical protein n=1 Tax=Frankia sp. CiP1_Cm_nod2 TaxID=2897161 RepID=UPI002024DA05